MKEKGLSENITELKQSLIDLFGKDDAAVRAMETKEQYVKIYHHFEGLRNKGIKYEQAILDTAEQFHVSESTAKRAVRQSEAMVHNNELT